MALDVGRGHWIGPIDGTSYLSDVSRCVLQFITVNTVAGNFSSREEEASSMSDKMIRTVRIPAAPETIWGVYVGLLAVLTTIEALSRPEMGLFDEVLDWSIVVLAFLGCGLAWGLSARRFVTLSAEKRTPSLAVRMAACSFAGPMFALLAILGINGVLDGDVDGGMLLFYLAVLAIHLPLCVIPIVGFGLSRN